MHVDALQIDILDPASAAHPGYRGQESRGGCAASPAASRAPALPAGPACQGMLPLASALLLALLEALLRLSIRLNRLRRAWLQGL